MVKNNQMKSDKKPMRKTLNVARSPKRSIEKSKTKQIGRIVKISTLVILGLIVTFLLVVFINHKVQTAKELELLKEFDTGEVIKIDGTKVNYKIFNPDRSEKTVILMPGLNVQDLALVFEPLAEKISARIILINRPGYAFSEETGHTADIDYIVEYHRKVLKDLNIFEPVILMPHSISGIYAMYWAEKYPEEIDGMIALDIGSPELYLDDDYNTNSPFQNRLLHTAASLGLHRLFILDDASRAFHIEELIKTGYFSRELAEADSILGMENAFPNFVVSEADLNRENSKKLLSTRGENYASLKKLFIIADILDEDYFEQYGRESALRDFGNDETALNEYLGLFRKYQKENREALGSRNSEFATIPGPHTIYEYPTDELIGAINHFLEN